MRERHIRELRDAATSALPPPLVETVLETEAPFLQAVFDVEVPRMAFGRVCLIGDAAALAVPAAENAWKLGEAIRETDGDVVAALERWERGQLELGRQVLARTRDPGQRLQGGTWRVGEPLPLGLYEVGDSSMP